MATAAAYSDRVSVRLDVLSEPASLQQQARAQQTELSFVKLEPLTGALVQGNESSELRAVCDICMSNGIYSYLSGRAVAPSAVLMLMPMLFRRAGIRC